MEEKKAYIQVDRKRERKNIDSLGWERSFFKSAFSSSLSKAIF
jgi:hypothetical protein